MRKVISMFTRQEVTELPIEAEHAKNVIEHLMLYANQMDVTSQNPEYIVIDFLIRMVENNSGVTKDDVLLERFLKTKEA